MSNAKTTVTIEIETLHTFEPQNIEALREHLDGGIQLLLAEKYKIVDATVIHIDTEG